MGWGAAAAALASLLHYNLIRGHRADAAEFAPEIQLSHLQRPGFAKVEDTNLTELKAFLAARGLASRPLPARV